MLASFPCQSVPAEIDAKSGSNFAMLCLSFVHASVCSGGFHRWWEMLLNDQPKLNQLATWQQLWQFFGN
jgi:hypothetical protein